MATAAADLEPSANAVVVYSDRRGRTNTPDLRFLHYNDVYHVEAGSREPVGGAARFQTLCNYYRDLDGPKMLTIFSGDAFNPSLESSITKGMKVTDSLTAGKHMVPVLNAIKTDVACVGNHDLDFGVPQFRYLAGLCEFPWLLANVLDPALGEDVPLGNAQKTAILTVNGIKIGFIGLVEREWLDTINSLPPNLIYKSVSATAKQLAPKLRQEGAEIVIAVTHQREPNDNKLATNNVPDGVDIVLGGHDHFYGHQVINGTHVLRSGTDFKQLSYIQAWRNKGKWDFEIIRRDIVQQIPEDPAMLALVNKLTSALQAKLEKPVGYTMAPLDARFTTVRLKESNLGNFVCDLMRLYYQADCALMAAGTIRGDQIYPPGIIRLKDLMNCFPFEDPVIVLRVKGAAILGALENAVSTYPALEGRFPQLSNMHFQFDPDAPAGNRVIHVQIGEEPLDMSKEYTLATRGYMGRGKDGYTSLLIESEGGTAKEIVSEENGVLISMILRQYFMSLKVLGKWKRWGVHMHRHWDNVHGDLHEKHPVKVSAAPTPAEVTTGRKRTLSEAHKSTLIQKPAKDAPRDSVDSESEEDEHVVAHVHATGHDGTLDERAKTVARRVLRKWRRIAQVGTPEAAGHGVELEEFEFTPVAWTKGIAPRLEGRIDASPGAKKA